MDRDELAGRAARAGDQELVSTGSFAGGDADPGRRRPRRVAVLLVCAGVLVGAFLWQQVGPGGDSATTGTAMASPARETTGRHAPTTGAVAPGAVGRSFDIRSGSETARLTVRLAQRVQTDTDHSAMGLILHLEMSSGVETITPDSFVAAGPDGLTAPATGVTVLVPGSQVAPSNDGFRISAPAALDIEVILPVPPGDQLVYLLSDATGETLACFPVSG